MYKYTHYIHITHIYTCVHTYINEAMTLGLTALPRRTTDQQNPSASHKKRHFLPDG